MYKQLEMTRRAAAIFCLAALTASAAGKQALAADTVLKLAHILPATHSVAGDAATLFAENVKKYTNGAVEVQVFPAGQLGSNEREMIESVKLGLIDMAITSTAVVTPYANRLKLFDIPFIFEDHAHATRVMDGPLGDQLKKDVEASGIVVLDFWSGGFRDVFNNVKPIKNPDDLSGVKIRVIQSPVYLETFKAFGALPVAMSPGELYSALQMGVVDAGENDPGNAVSMKFTEVSKYWSVTHHAFAPMPLTINGGLFRGLPQETQDAIQRAADDATAYQRPAAEGLWKEAMDRIKETGVQINEVEDINAFRERVKPIYEKYDAELGGDLIRLTTEARTAAQ